MADYASPIRPPSYEPLCEDGASADIDGQLGRCVRPFPPHLGAIRPEEVWAPRGLNAISVPSGSSGAGRSCHSGRASALTFVKASIPAFV
jgi:hypothetical protein